MNLLAIQICEDDEEIKTLLVKHGKQTHLIPRIETNGPFRTHITWADREYAYTVTQYHDYEVPEDNGYCAIRIPLAGATAQELSIIGAGRAATNAPPASKRRVQPELPVRGRVFDLE